MILTNSESAEGCERGASGQAFGESFLEEAAFELGLGGWLTVGERGRA